MEEWPLGMSGLCCSEAAETAVQKEDTPEQIGWTFAQFLWEPLRSENSEDYRCN